MRSMLCSCVILHVSKFWQRPVAYAGTHGETGTKKPSV